MLRTSGLGPLARTGDDAVARRGSSPSPHSLIGDFQRRWPTAPDSSARALWHEITVGQTGAWRERQTYNAFAVNVRGSAGDGPCVGCA